MCHVHVSCAVWDPCFGCASALPLAHSIATVTAVPLGGTANAAGGTAAALTLEAVLHDKDPQGRLVLLQQLGEPLRHPVRVLHQCEPPCIRQQA